MPRCELFQVSGGTYACKVRAFLRHIFEKSPEISIDGFFTTFDRRFWQFDA